MWFVQNLLHNPFDFPYTFHNYYVRDIINVRNSAEYIFCEILIDYFASIIWNLYVGEKYHYLKTFTKR